MCTCRGQCLADPMVPSLHGGSRLFWSQPVHAAFTGAWLFLFFTVYLLSVIAIGKYTSSCPLSKTGLYVKVTRMYHVNLCVFVVHVQNCHAINIEPEFLMRSCILVYLSSYTCFVVFSDIQIFHGATSFPVGDDVGIVHMCFSLIPTDKTETNRLVSLKASL